jgi:hypothetical protein
VSLAVSVVLVAARLSVAMFRLLWVRTEGMRRMAATLRGPFWNRG